MTSRKHYEYIRHDLLTQTIQPSSLPEKLNSFDKLPTGKYNSIGMKRWVKKGSPLLPIYNLATDFFIEDLSDVLSSYGYQFPPAPGLSLTDVTGLIGQNEKSFWTGKIQILWNWTCTEPWKN